MIKFNIIVFSRLRKGQTIRKVMGGVGKKTKKKSCKGKCREKKIRAEKKVKKKIHAEERSNPRPCYINMNNK